ncbi:MAG TPA: hypothetical protein VH092_32440, partial [Urbifossiella sp.]|nr:hypothetical protein [Urbifossiella sp.]
MGLSEFAAVLAVAGAIALVVRGWDVRLVLLAAGLATAATTDAAAGKVAALPEVVRQFLMTFSNEKFVVPICSAMGFAYVLRHTGCERHLVLLLVAPLRSVRVLLVPGVVLVGFLVNIPVISQTSTAVCIGPVVVPLMRAAGYSFATIGACLLLGASVGGELLNPGAPELLTVASYTKVPTPTQVSEYLPRPVLVQLVVSLVVIWVMSVWWERAEAPSGGPGDPEAGTGAGQHTTSSPPFPPREGGPGGLGDHAGAPGRADVSTPPLAPPPGGEECLIGVSSGLAAEAGTGAGQVRGSFP